MTVEQCYVCDTVANSLEDASLAIAYNDLAVAAWSPYPAPDWAPQPPELRHIVIAPWEHKESWFELSQAEFQAVHRVGQLVASRLSIKYGIEDFNFLIQEGGAALKPSAHTYQQMLLRVRGDVDDPRGGIRYAVDPSSANYLLGPTEGGSAV